MTYGPNLNDSYAHLATYVDKILKGAKPADLPVELPTSVEFVINAQDREGDRRQAAPVDARARQQSRRMSPRRARRAAEHR